MPHLRLCGLHFRVGSDDFVLPGLLGIVYRTTWTACCAAILDFARKGSSCGSGLVVYLSLAVGLYATSILIEVGVVWQSRRGTMAEVDKRSSVGTLLQLHTCVLLCELGCSIYGALLLWNRVMNGQLTKCSSELIYQQESMTALLSAVVISQFINVLGFSTCACCSLRNESKASSDDHALQKWLQRQKMLTFGAFCCSCSLTGGKRLFGQSSLIELEQVAMTLTQFFHHSGFLDLVPTDVIAGLLLVRMQQRASAAASATATTPTTTANVLASVENDADVEASQHLYEGNDESYSRKSVLELSGHEKRAQHVNAAPRRILDAQSKEEDKQLLELVYYGNFFAWGVYSYFMYLFSYPFTGWCRLCSAACGHCTGIQPLMTASGSGSGSSRNNAVVHGDGCSSANTLSMHFMLQHHGKIQATLLYASFVNDVAKPPFSIHIDEANKKVVISVRGTWSLEDVVTDGKVLPLDLEDLGKEWGFDGKNRVAHRGFAEAAVHICREIEEKKLLEQFDWTSTRLLFVGHSMGAAVAALMALFYSQKYPSNYCLGYGMPGSVVDEVTASELSSRILSIVCGKDIVPRLSFHSLAHLRREVLDSIARCKVNKFEVLKAATASREEDLEKILDLLLLPRGEAPKNGFTAMIDSFNAEMDAKHTFITPLFLPGKVLHFVGETSSSSSKRRYLPFETSWRALSEIVVSSKMLLEHMPDRYLQATGENMV